MKKGAKKECHSQNAFDRMSKQKRIVHVIVSFKKKNVSETFRPIFVVVVVVDSDDFYEARDFVV